MIKYKYIDKNNIVFVIYSKESYNIMVPIFAILVLTSSLGPSLSQKTDIGLNTAGIIENHGYTCENHNIVTEDGYILTYQRIPHGKNETSTNNNPPLIIMHGIMESSADFVNMGPNRSISFILADLGYDVWLANARGNYWSRNETLQKLAPRQFFNYSWEEIGRYDLAAACDYILNLTNSENLYYIGHSQGGTDLLALTSMRPEYNNKFKLSIMLAPGCFFEHESYTNIFGLACRAMFFGHKLLRTIGIYEILPGLDKIRHFLSPFCQYVPAYPICGLIYYTFGANQFINNRLGVIFTNFPSNSAVKQFTHYGQLMIEGGFKRFNYGSRKNHQYYGQKTPPSYNFTNVVTPIAILYSKGDRIVNHKDITTLTQTLPNLVYSALVPPKIGHLDIISTPIVTDPNNGELIKIFKTYG